MLRAVLDTNVAVAAMRSVKTGSPNAEFFARWVVGEFVWLVSDDVLAEYAEKLLQRGVDPLKVEHPVAGLLLFGEEIPIRFFHFQHEPVAFLADLRNSLAT
jgi:predicted nucleic acid-binding protein